jgi:hypothetical protein
VVSFLDLFVVVFVECEVESAGGVEFDIDAGLIAERGSEGRVKVATATREREKIVVTIGFNLRQQHATSRRRRLRSQSAAFKQTNIAHTTLCKRARNS